MQKTPALTAALISAALLVGTLSGCASSTDSGSRLISFPGAYKIDIQQGTVITQEMVDQLRPGMNRSQVQYVMGSPLLEDAFDRDRWDYIYSMQPGGEKRTQQTLTIFFDNEQLVSVEGDLRPTPKP